MKIIYNLEELEGSCYIEVLPGKYNGESWNQGSIFFEEEDFGFLETAIKKEFESYDHYAFNVIPKEVWEKIILRFQTIMILSNEVPREEIRNHIGFIFQSSESDFTANLEENMNDLIAMIKNFISWIKARLEDHSFISILGI